jgi:hypothetical protein
MRLNRKDIKSIVAGVIAAPAVWGFFYIALGAGGW